MFGNNFGARRGVGGTPGGLTEFIIGALMIIVGGYLFFNNLVVSSSLSVIWGRGGSGAALLILLAGIGLLFFSARSRTGWLLVLLGAVVIIINVVSHLTVYFRATSFFETLVMLGLMFGGLGMVARALRPHWPEQAYLRRD